MRKHKLKYKSNLIECSNDYFFEATVVGGSDDKDLKTELGQPANAGAAKSVEVNNQGAAVGAKAPTLNTTAVSTPQDQVTPDNTAVQAADQGQVTPVGTNGLAAGNAAATSEIDPAAAMKATNDVTNQVDNAPEQGEETANNQSLATPTGNMSITNPGGSGLTTGNIAQAGSELSGGSSKNLMTSVGSAGGAQSFDQRLQRNNVELLSKLLPTESELKTMTKEELSFVKDMIFNSGLTEAMIDKAKNDRLLNKQLNASKDLAREVLEDPINAVHISNIISKESNSFDSINNALNLMGAFVDGSEHNAKISNDTLSNALKNLSEVINTGIRSMQKLINENADWLSIVMSKPLNQWNIAFAETPLKNWKCSQLFTFTAVACSVVFTCSKILSTLDQPSLATNTVENNVKKLRLIKRALKESKAVFGGISYLIEAGLDAESKLSRYADGRIPTNIILINSMILKAGKPAKEILTRVVSEKEADTTVDKSIMINRPFYALCTFASAFVLLWIKIAGMYIKNANDVNIVSNMMSDKIRAKIDPSEKNVLKALFGGLQSKMK